MAAAPPSYSSSIRMSFSTASTKSSTHSSHTLWADTPYPLIPSPRHPDDPETGALFIASEMANIHNMLLRGLNSILLQGEHVGDATTPSYEPRDISDFLTYCLAWCHTLQHHHDNEEQTLFPLIDRMCGTEGMMDELEEQHEEFEYAVLMFRQYVGQMAETPQYYRWREMKRMIESFAPALVFHLHDEIDFLLSMKDFDSAGLRRCWLQTEKVAVRIDSDVTKFLIMPFVLGNSDKSNGCLFPPLPKPVQYAIKLWYASKYRGAWRFNTCDFAGRPQPLVMLSENRRQEC